MSFGGAYATLAARADGNAFGCVVEITLNEEQWDPGDGTLTDEMNLSSGPCHARSRAYDPLITDWGGGIRQRIELKAAGLVEHTCSIKVADPDNRVRNALVNGNQRHSAVAIYRVILGNATAWDRRFTGILDAWSFTAGEVELKFKTDERVTWTNQPRWPLLRSEWFQMPQKEEGTYAALIYGKHDGTGLVDTGEDPHGMIPAVPVWIGSNHWYELNLGPASFVKDVYVDGVLQVGGGTDYNAVYNSLAGGKTFTIIEFVTTPADDAKVTANVYGYTAEDFPDGTGTDVATNPVSQIRHFLVNFATNQSRGYVPGGWDTTASIIDSTSWDAAAAWADARGIEGARYLGDQQTCGQRFTEWLESFPAFRSFWNTEGAIELTILSAQWPGYWNGSDRIISREDCIKGSFAYDIDADDVTRKISTRYMFDSVGGEFLRTLDVEDLSVAELADTRLDMYWSPARIVA